MVSDETTLALSHTNNNRHQTLFQNDPNSSFRHPVAGSSSNNKNNSNNSGKATRELTGFIDHQHRYYHQSMYDSGSIRNHGMQNWDGGNARGSDGSDGDRSDGEDGDDDEEDVEGGGNGSGKDGNVKLNRISSFGSRREVLKVGSLAPTGNDLNDVKPTHQQELIQYHPNAVALVDRDGELYYSQYLHGTEGLASGSGVKDTAVENGCGFSGRKDGSYAGESGDSLRAILSDPLTGALMDDAMILPCGHSFGSGGMQHVMKMKACHTCSRLVTEDTEWLLI